MNLWFLNFSRLFLIFFLFNLCLILFFFNMSFFTILLIIFRLFINFFFLFVRTIFNSSRIICFIFDLSTCWFLLFDLVLVILLWLFNFHLQDNFFYYLRAQRILIWQKNIFFYLFNLQLTFFFLRWKIFTITLNIFFDNSIQIQRYC